MTRSCFHITAGAAYSSGWFSGTDDEGSHVCEWAWPGGAEVRVYASIGDLPEELRSIAGADAEDAVIVCSRQAFIGFLTGHDARPGASRMLLCPWENEPAGIRRVWLRWLTRRR